MERGVEGVGTDRHPKRVRRNDVADAASETVAGGQGHEGAANLGERSFVRRIVGWSGIREARLDG